MTVPDLGALRSLRDRVAAAGGPDRDIDQDLFCDLGLCPRGEDGILDAYRAPRYSESLDAVVALVERVLPDATWTIHSNGNAIVYPGGKRQFSDTAPTDALALLTALLKALIAQRERDNATPPRGTGTAGEGEATPGPDGRRGET